MPLKTGDWMDYWGNDHPKCPHCDADYDISAHEHWDLYDTNEGEHEIDCPLCDQQFTVKVCCAFTFNTDEQPDEDDGDE
jgi:hypothetical protein